MIVNNMFASIFHRTLHVNRSFFYSFVVSDVASDTLIIVFFRLECSMILFKVLNINIRYMNMDMIFDDKLSFYQPSCSDTDLRPTWLGGV